jgi:hypothetical protein
LTFFSLLFVLRLIVFATTITWNVFKVFKTTLFRVDSVFFRAIWGNYKSGMLNGKGGAELDDKEETILEGDFVDGMLEGKVRIFSF